MIGPRWVKLLRDVWAERGRFAGLVAAIAVSLVAVAAILGADTIRLADGSAIQARGIASRDALAAIPQRGEPVRLGLSVADTVLLADSDAGT